MGSVRFQFQPFARRRSDQLIYGLSLAGYTKLHAQPILDRSTVSEAFESVNPIFPYSGSTPKIRGFGHFFLLSSIIAGTGIEPSGSRQAHDFA